MSLHVNVKNEAEEVGKFYRVYRFHFKGAMGE